MFREIYLTSFLVACTGNLLSISLALFLAHVKQSGPLILGLVGFTTNLASTITTFLLAGHPVQKRNLIFFYAPVGIGILYFLVPFIPVPAIFICLLITGMFYGFFWPSIQRCFANTDDELRIGVFNLSWSAGVIVGSFAAGIIFAINPRYPFFIGLALALCATTAILSKKKSLACMNTGPLTVEKKQVLPAEKIREVRLLLFLHFIATSMVFFLYPKLGLTRGFSPQFIGSVAGLLLMSRFIGFSLLMDKPVLLHPAGFLVSCIMFFASCCLVGFGNTPYIVILGVLIMGLAGAFTYHNSLQMHLKCGLKTEIHEGIVGAGTFLGALVGGVLGQIFGLPTAYLLIGIGIFLSGLWHNGCIYLKRTETQ